MGPNALKFFHSLARKGLTKNRGSGITEIADRMAVESEAASMIQTLVDSGLPLERFDQFIRSEADVLKYLNIIKNAKPVSTTEKASGIILPFKQKRSFKEEIEAMKKSGDIVDTDNMIISDKITEREMFKNSNLNKPTIEEQMEKITGASNRIKEIQKEIDEMYRPKTDAEIKAKYDKQNKESIQKFKDKMKKDEPEDKADGGRMGFRTGKFVLDKIIANLLKDKNKIKQAADDIFPTGDYKYDAQMAADALVENNPKIFKNKLYDDLDINTQIEIYGAVLEPIQKNMSIARKIKNASRPEKTLAAMKEGRGIDMSDPNIADEFTRFMKETDPQGSKTIEQTVELANFDPKKVKGNAEGGRIGYYTGGITDVEPSLDDIGHGSDSLMSRTRLMSPGAQATTSTGLNYLLAEDNDNLRIPFAGGGDPKRRAFLKLLATLTGGIAGVKSGFIGLGEGTAKKAVSETVKKAAGSGTPPPYFFKLVDKIKTMGDDVTKKSATQEREVVTKYKDFELTENIATGEKTIQRKKPSDFEYYDEQLYEDVYMNYKPGKGQADEAAPKVADEYTEDTSYIRTSGPQKGDVYDTVDGVPKDVVQEGTVFEDNITEFGMTKKADGGRIGFSGGGIFRAIIAKSAAKAGMKPYEYIKVTSYKSLPPEVKMFMSKADFEKLKMGQEQMYSNYIDMAKTRQEFQKNIEGGKNTPARELFEGMEKTMDEQSFVPKTVTSDDIAEMELMVKNRFNKGRKDNANGGIQTMLGE